MESTKQIPNNTPEGGNQKEDCRITTDPQSSKIPRPQKFTKKKSPSRDITERPTSAKTVSHLESIYKSNVIKFNKEVVGMQTQNKRITDIIENMVKIRDELEEKGHKDLPDLPEIPPMDQIQSSLSEKSCKNYNSKIKLLKKARENVKTEVTKESADEIKSRRTLESGVIEMYSEMPALHSSLKGLEESLNIAHEKQNVIESNLHLYKTDIKYIMDNLEDFMAIKINSQNLIKELNKLKDAFDRETKKHSKELSVKDEELAKLKQNLDNELLKRVALEETFDKIRSLRDNEIQPKLEFDLCINEMLDSPLISNSERQELAIENNNLKFELEELKNEMVFANEKIADLVQLDSKNKEFIQSLEHSNEEILCEFINICQNNFFEKENMIFQIKNKMDSIVSLKNSLMSQDAGDPLSDLKVIMNINDIYTLKKEIAHLHKRLIDIEETRDHLECALNSKTIQITELENELSSKYLEIETLEGVLETMKERERGHSELLAKIEFSSGVLLEDQESHGDNEEKLKELVKWQDKQRSVITELERKLKASDNRYVLAEERRIRNEERIARLQLKLAQYEQME